MKLRTGRTKSILASSLDSALLAVEVYNKPRTQFRTQAFISLMVIAWTRLFHAYFYHTIGDRYYYKVKNSTRYQRVEGDRKAWDLRTCIAKYGNLSEPVKANLELFIRLRNKIEHRNIEKKELDVLIFGECQALLMNFEDTVITLFGPEYALNENLAYALQFSAMRTQEQAVATRRALSVDVADLKVFLSTYRSSLKDDVFNSQAYSIKLIQIPKISNTNRNDMAIEFVRWNELSEEDKKLYDKVDVLIKDRVVKKPVLHLGGMKPSKVLLEVKKRCGVVVSHYDHKCLYVIFGVRPEPADNDDPFNTNPDYCHYDEVHDDYVYSGKWVDCLEKILGAGKLKPREWKRAYQQRKRYEIAEYV